MSDDEFHDVGGEFGDEFGDTDTNTNTNTTTQESKEQDDQIPTMQKDSAAARTIFVTQQFRSFDDDYVRVRPIGEPGQFGTAYECYGKHDQSKSRRCVKEINKSRFHHISPKARDEILFTMQNEITTLKKVDHPNIVKLYDVYEDRHFLHLVMEFLPGGELFDRIADADHPFSEKEAANCMKQVLEALDHMHDKNILHLDLKPENILFADSKTSVIKLIDFGMARVVPRLAKLKGRVGTPNYMAPEVIDCNYSKAADVWSAGVILFCILFGYPPFSDMEDNIRLDESHVESAIKLGFDPTVKPGYGAWFPADIQVSDNCRRLLSKMLRTDVKERWTVKECLSSKWVLGNCPSDAMSPIVKDALKRFHGTSRFKLAISNMFSHKLDADHVDSVKKFFNDLDADGDGNITLKEFKHGMKTKFKTEMTEEQLDNLFAMVDFNADHKITLNELLTISTNRMLVDEDERLYQVFSDLDENGDGQISKDELANAMNKCTNLSTQCLQKMQSAFETADLNNDGNIDYEEFLLVLHPDFRSDMNIASFTQTETGTGQVRAARFDVHGKAGSVDTYMMPQQMKDNLSNSAGSKNQVLALQKQVRELKTRVAELIARAEKAEQERDALLKK